MELYENLLQIQKEEKKAERVNYAMVIFVILFCLALTFVRTQWLYCVEVSGSSMVDTVYTKDLLLVDKLANVERGDVIVFTANKSYIKRVIAVGGDTIKCENGKVYVKYAGEEIWNYDEHSLDYNGNYTTPHENLLTEQVVKQGYVFVMGDNRSNSNDSRSQSFAHATGFEGGQVAVTCIDGVVSQFVIDNRNGFLGFFYRYL